MVKELPLIWKLILPCSPNPRFLDSTKRINKWKINQLKINKIKMKISKYKCIYIKFYVNLH